MQFGDLIPSPYFKDKTTEASRAQCFNYNYMLVADSGLEIISPREISQLFLYFINIIIALSFSNRYQSILIKKPLKFLYNKMAF